MAEETGKADLVVNNLQESWLVNEYGRCPGCGSRRYRDARMNLRDIIFTKQCVDCSTFYDQRRDTGLIQ